MDPYPHPYPYPNWSARRRLVIDNYLQTIYIVITTVTCISRTRVRDFVAICSAKNYQPIADFSLTSLQYIHEQSAISLQPFGLGGKK